MRGLTEERGARQAILHQAAFYPEEGLSYKAFLKVLPLPQQAAGRQLLREGYLLRNANNGIVLSPLIKKEAPAWNESTRAFLTSLTEYLTELISEELIANHRAKQAKSDVESLRTLVFLCSAGCFSTI